MANIGCLLFYWVISLALLENWTPVAWCKLYKHNIYKKLPRKHREWGGMHTNTGHNFGGWLVRITNGQDGGISCGGAYYSPLLVLTSANCIQQLRYSLDEATVFGTAILPTDIAGIYSPIDTIYTPDNFVVNKNFMDIAIARLVKPLPGKLTEFIKLCKQNIINGAEMTAFSWEIDNSTPAMMRTENPLKTTVYLKDLNECKKYYGNEYNLTYTSLCVKSANNHSSCSYYEGSPLIWKNQLCGIVSLDPYSCERIHPGVYTNIRSVKQFIEMVEEYVASGKLP